MRALSFGQNKIMMKEIPPRPQVHRLTTTRRFDQTLERQQKSAATRWAFE
jgi:hypothetical protein